MSSKSTLQRIGITTVVTLALAASGASSALADVRTSTADPQAFVSAVDQDAMAAARAKLPPPTPPISSPPTTQK